MRLQPLILDKFTRVNDRTKPDLLKPDELQDLQNCVLDYKIFKPIKRGKFTRYDAGVSAGNDILCLDDAYIGGKHYLLGAVNTVLQTYDVAGNSWASRIGSLTAGFKFRMKAWKDKFIVVFDTDDDPRMIDEDSGTVWNLDLATADVSAIQSFHKTGGNLTNNTLYKYIIVGVTADGQLGVPSRPFTHFYDTGRDLTTDDGTNSDQVYLKNLPHIADSRVVARLLFRTKGDTDVANTTNKTGEVYYLLATLNNDSAGSVYQSEFEDNIADDDLGTDIVIYTNMPTRAKFLSLNKDRLFLANFTQIKRNFFSPPSSKDGGSQTGWTVGYELVATDSTTGTLNAETQYDYKIHWVDKEGRLSKHYHEISHTTSAGSNDKYVQIDGIGLVDIETSELLRVKIYRQTGGSGDFYLIFETDLKGLTFSGVATNGLYAPDVGRFVDFGLSNGTETWSDPDDDTENHPCRVIWSDLESPSSFREENYFDMYPEDGDIITGMFDDVDGILIFKERSICKIFTPSGSPLNWNRVKLLEEYGCSNSWTLQKSGRYYYFVYIKDGTHNKVYRYAQGMERPEDIGELFQDFLDGIDDFYDSAINDEWYVLQCIDGTKFYTLVYDIKLKTWYKWTRSQDGSEDFKTLHFIKFGSDAGKLISNADDYVSLYNQPTDSARQDSEIGSNKDITPIVKTKDFKFPDGITLARLRKLKFDYKKTASKDTTIIITDADTQVTLTLTDDSGSGLKLYESGIGRASDTLKTSRSFNVKVQGAGLEEFENLRIDYRPIRRGNQVGR